VQADTVDDEQSRDTLRVRIRIGLTVIHKVHIPYSEQAGPVRWRQFLEHRSTPGGEINSLEASGNPRQWLHEERLAVRAPREHIVIGGHAWGGASVAVLE
jgi:hypothetical protein